MNMSNSLNPALAQSLLDRLQATFGRAVRELALRCARDGRLDAQRLERALRQGLTRLHALGATDFAAVCVPIDPGAVERTLALLSDVSRGGSP